MKILQSPTPDPNNHGFDFSNYSLHFSCLYIYIQYTLQRESISVLVFYLADFIHHCFEMHPYVSLVDSLLLKNSVT